MLHLDVIMTEFWQTVEYVGCCYPINTQIIRHFDDVQGWLWGHNWAVIEHCQNKCLITPFRRLTAGFWTEPFMLLSKTNRKVLALHLNSFRIWKSLPYLMKASALRNDLYFSLTIYQNVVFPTFKTICNRDWKLKEIKTSELKPSSVIRIAFSLSVSCTCE